MMQYFGVHVSLTLCTCRIPDIFWIAQLLPVHHGIRVLTIQGNYEHACILIREHFEIQLTIKISEIRLRRFGIILTPLSSRNKDNGRVSNLNTNKGDRVC